MTEIEIIKQKILFVLTSQTVDCIQCDYRFLVENEYKKIKCKRCGREFQLYKMTNCQKNLDDIIAKDTDLIRLNRVYNFLKTYRTLNDSDREKYDEKINQDVDKFLNKDKK